MLIDGKAVKSCLILARQAQGRDILTVEGLAKDGKLDPLQQAFIDGFAVQCGFCTPGFVMATEALLKRNPKPSEEEIRKGISGNLCRCTGYDPIVRGIKKAAEKGNGLW